jgi:type II secretory ATPase GspE/PulE/Tfp pilus assembly ATPase PilB-like protein
VASTTFEVQDKTEAAPGGHKPGDFLTEAAVVSPGQLMLALDHQSKMPAIRVGEALLRLGYVDENQLQQALAEQSGKSSKRVGELLVQAGALSRRDLNTALAHKMGYPFVDVTRFPIEPAALEKIPFSTAQRLMVLPLLARNDLTVVVAADPTRREMVEELEFLLQGRVITTLGDQNDISQTITAAYDRLAKGGWQTDEVEPKAEPPEQASGHDLLESLELRTAPMAPAADQVPKVAESGASLSKLVHTMITEAFARGASDIHVETQAHQAKVRIRFRQDGLLAPYLELPHTYRSALVAQLKIMADLDVSQQHQPQDGKIDFKKFSPQHGLELRLTTIPTAHGLEDVVLHLLSSPKPLALDQLDLLPDQLEGLRRAVGQQVGMVLCAGPAGSGKTTTLHALLQDLDRRGPD